mgnify:FL=1
MKVNWEDVQEDYKKKDERIIELEKEVMKLKLFQVLAFDAHPNIDTDIESYIQSSPRG